MKIEFYRNESMGLWVASRNGVDGISDSKKRAVIELRLNENFKSVQELNAKKKILSRSQLEMEDWEFEGEDWKDNFSVNDGENWK